MGACGCNILPCPSYVRIFHQSFLLSVAASLAPPWCMYARRYDSGILGLNPIGLSAKLIDGRKGMEEELALTPLSSLRAITLEPTSALKTRML